MECESASEGGGSSGGLSLVLSPPGKWKPAAGQARPAAATCRLLAGNSIFFAGFYLGGTFFFCLCSTKISTEICQLFSKYIYAVSFCLYYKNVLHCHFNLLKKSDYFRNIYDRFDTLIGLLSVDNNLKLHIASTSLCFCFTLIYICT